MTEGSLSCLPSEEILRIEMSDVKLYWLHELCGREPGWGQQMSCFSPFQRSEMQCTLTCCTLTCDNIVLSFWVRNIGVNPIYYLSVLWKKTRLWISPAHQGNFAFSCYVVDSSHQELFFKFQRKPWGLHWHRRAPPCYEGTEKAPQKEKQGIYQYLNKWSE